MYFGKWFEVKDGQLYHNYYFTHLKNHNILVLSHYALRDGKLSSKNVKNITSYSKDSVSNSRMEEKDVPFLNNIQLIALKEAQDELQLPNLEFILWRDHPKCKSIFKHKYDMNKKKIELILDLISSKEKVSILN